MNSITTECSDRKLADLVAERVMGWHSQPIAWAYNLETYCWHEGDIALMSTASWHPDQDDRQCMMVLDKLAALGYQIQTILRSHQCDTSVSGPNGKHCRVVDTCRRRALLRAATEIITS